jgi:uncharacterized protein
MNKPTSPNSKSSIVRWAMAGIGLLFVAIGGLGVFLPVLPTTIFLILASYFFTRSCPVLDDWLRSRTIFKPYRRYLDRTEPMPVHAIASTLILIWAALGFTAFRLWNGARPVPLATGLVVLGLIASVSVVWYGRGTRATVAREPTGD